jgi:hypothetical protein
LPAPTTRASGRSARLAAPVLIQPYGERPQPITFGAGKSYDSIHFVMELRNKAVTPDVAQNQERPPLGGRSPHHLPSRLCGLPAHPQTHRGGVRWAKKVAGLSRMRHRGLPKVDWQFTPTMAAFDLLNCSLRMFGYPAYRSDHVTFAPHNSQLIGATLARNRSVIIADTEGR